MKLKKIYRLRNYLEHRNLYSFSENNDYNKPLFIDWSYGNDKKEIKIEKINNESKLFKLVNENKIFSTYTFIENINQINEITNNFSSKKVYKIDCFKMFDIIFEELKKDINKVLEYNE